MNNSFKELHIRMRHLSLFYYDEIPLEDLEIIDMIALKNFEDIENNTFIIKTMIEIIEKNKEKFSSE